jgi:hypothetical protein
MRRLAWCFAPPMVAAVALALGCGSGDSGAPKAVTAKTGQPKAAKTATGKAAEVAVVGWSTIKGRVTYNGDEKPGPKYLQPTKDQDKCPKEVPGEGWYVNEENKGLQYAVVFLKPPAGARMPKPKGEGEAGNVEVGQPHCQFEPRVVVLKPWQKLVFINDSDPGIAHDSNLSGVTFNYQKTLPPGQRTDPIDPDPSDRSPYKVSCAIHAGFMGAYVWRPSHPWMTVTDKDGNYELKDVPVLEGGRKMILAVWHEMLPGDRTMEIGEVDANPDEVVTKDFAIPKK